MFVYMFPPQRGKLSKQKVVSYYYYYYYYFGKDYSDTIGLCKNAAGVLYIVNKYVGAKVLRARGSIMSIFKKFSNVSRFCVLLMTSLILGE